VVIRLSDRILWTAFLESLGFAGEAARAVLQVVDRSAKMKPEARREALAVAAPERDPDELWSELGQFMELRGFTELESFAAASGNFGLTARLADWKILLEALEARGIGDYIKVDLSIVRGIAYYTGFVFEVFPASGQGRALAGGGRYDHLVEKVAGVSLPAVGFGMGDVTLADLLAELGRLPPIVGEGEIWMAALGSEERKVMLADATRLRRIGLKVDYSLQAASNLGKQLKEADRKKARIALIYGKDELDQGKVQVKFLASRATHEVPRASLIEFLRYGPDDSSGPAE
jgi:histidyl-tRNA synthetase